MWVMIVMRKGSALSTVRYRLERGRLERGVGMKVRRYDRKDTCDFPLNSRATSGGIQGLFMIR